MATDQYGRPKPRNMIERVAAQLAGRKPCGCRTDGSELCEQHFQLLSAAERLAYLRARGQRGRGRGQAGKDTQ